MSKAWLVLTGVFSFLLQYVERVLDLKGPASCIEHKIVRKSYRKYSRSFGSVLSSEKD